MACAAPAALLATFPERRTAVHLEGSSFSEAFLLNNSFIFNGRKIAYFQQELDNLFHVLAHRLHYVCNLIFLFGLNS